MKKQMIQLTIAQRPDTDWDETARTAAIHYRAKPFTINDTWHRPHVTWILHPPFSLAAMHRIKQKVWEGLAEAEMVTRDLPRSEKFAEGHDLACGAAISLILTPTNPFEIVSPIDGEQEEATA